MRQLVFLTVILAMATATLGQGWEGEESDDLLVSKRGDLHGTVGVSLDSMYVWRGFRMFENQGALHFLADLNLFDTGLGISVTGHRPIDSALEDRERWDYTVYYQNSLFSGEAYATNFRVGGVYYNYSRLNQDECLDLIEGHVILSWPNILPIKGLCPSYVIARQWTANSDSDDNLPNAAEGYFHILMLDYGFTVPGIVSWVDEHLIKLHSEVIYNGGVTAAPFGGVTTTAAYPNPEYGISHAVVGASTDMDLGHGIMLTPSAYYQFTFEDTVNDNDDEMWATLSLTYSF
jgi:hypothetical protein